MFLCDDLIDRLIEPVVGAEQLHDSRVEQPVVALTGVQRQPIQRAGESHSEDHLDPPSVAVGAVHLVVVVMPVIVVVILPVIGAIIAVITLATRVIIRLGRQPVVERQWVTFGTSA